MPAKRAEPQTAPEVNGHERARPTGSLPRSASAEVAEILAGGILRLRARELGIHHGDEEQVSLDYSPGRSVHADRLRPPENGPVTNSIAAQLVAITRMPTAELRTLWKDYFGQTRRSSAGGT